VFCWATSAVVTTLITKSFPSSVDYQVKNIGKNPTKVARDVGITLRIQAIPELVLAFCARIAAENYTVANVMAIACIIIESTDRVRGATEPNWQE
jgi:hypothetical protein